MSERPNPSEEVLVIEAGKTARLYWRDLWRYRELFLFLAWRDILVRYKQTLIGIAWAVLRPLLQMLALTIVFGRVAGLQSPDAPYAVMVFAGILPWNFFANGLSDSSQSLLNNRNMVTKVYFPRLIIPCSSLVTGLVDFVIAAGILGGMMVWYGFMPSPRVILLPLFLFLAVGAALGTGLWVSALNVRYRDIRYIIPFVVQFGLLISPVGFRSEEVDGHWRLLYSANPMVGVIDGFRWSIIGGEHQLYIPGLLISVVAVLLVSIGGIYYFRRVERTFADVI